MPKKRLHHLTTGKMSRTSLIKRSLAKIWPLISAAVFCLTAGQALAATVPPIHRLAISFDLARGILSGESTIEFPANIGGSYHFDGLTVSRIQINDLIIDLDDRSQAYFADPIHGLTISPQPVTQKITVIYSMTCAPNQGPAAGLINESGIALTGSWHPFLHQDTIFELTAEIPSDFEAISEADEIITTQTETGKNVKFVFPYPVNGINFIAGPYLVEKEGFGDNLELYSYFFPEDQELAADYRQKTLAYLRRYEDLIGPYPYKRFSIVENRLPTGFAMPTFTLLGQAVVRLPFITDTSLGHEILHEWFGNAVGIDTAEGNWAEGLTTYLADQTYAEEKGEGSTFRKNQIIKYLNYVPENNNMPAGKFIGSDSYVEGFPPKANQAIGYGRVSMLFHMLKKSIGDELFYEALRDFYDRMKYHRASWSNLAASFEVITKTKMANTFHQWLNRPDLPGLYISKQQIDETAGQPVLKFSLMQIAKNPYEMDVPITIQTANEEITRLFTITGQETKLEIPLTTLPRKLVIDANYDLMRRLANTEMPPVWSGFEGAGKKLAVLDPESADIFAPFLTRLSSMGCTIKKADEVTDREISEGSVIFLGVHTPIARSLFATTNHPATGLTIDIRANPLNRNQTAVLVSAADPEETDRGSAKLTHYGKYSYLHFEQGRLVEKKITDSAMGQEFTLDVPPGGIEIKNNLGFDQIMERLRPQKVVYVAESHTRNEDHQLQIRVLRAMHDYNPKLAIGMEMFTRQVQPILDRFIKGEIDEKEFLAQSHYFIKWGYDYRYYQPILNFARLNQIPVIALNLEKDIVSKVYQEDGLSSLTEEEANSLPPDRNLDMAGYKERITNVYKMHNPPAANESKLNDFFQAQALWDETMAESITNYLAAHPEEQMLVIAGRGHMGKDTGIPPRVERRIPGIKQAVLLNVEQNEVDAKVADFLLFSPPTTLPPAALMGIMLEEAAEGVTIGSLSPHGQAGKSGLKKNDLILALDGKPVKNIEDIKLIMFYKKRGEKVQVQVKRTIRFWPDPTLNLEVQL
ncbi:MAG: ChaN family lipoprotein [Proteobacteria bacterium]|nr:ChaN family lipoprotein [Pseudomonadota bacterium]MBU1714443.1 ChaN family lipoprotein [Pseudomonadota bacterium]